MSRKLTRALTAVLMVFGSLLAMNLAAPFAYATTPTVLTWPGVQTPYAEFYAHGDGSFTLAKGCGSASSTDTTPSVVTYDSSYTHEYVVNKVPETGWKVLECEYTRTAGYDKSVYFTEQTTSGATAFRVVAMQGNLKLWSANFGASCGQPNNLSLGFDGNLYLTIACGSFLKLAGIDGGTGSILFENNLPSSTASSVPNSILPYNTGLAVVNNGVHVYYYHYGDGNADSSAITFSPIAPSGSTAVGAQISATGRTYLVAQYYDGPSNTHRNYIYYKEVTSSTISRITLPSNGANLQYNTIQVTPAGGIAIRQSSTVSMYDSTGTDLYDITISADKSSYLVDDLGNLIVERTVVLSNNDLDVIVDAYDSSGAKTTLFDADSLYGTPGLDVFETNTDILPQSIGGGKMYIALCHRTSYPSSYNPYRECVSATDNPEIVAISMPGSADYPRSSLFSTIGSLTNYAALGDSYSSGEGNPPFMEGTDNNGGDGCDRSYNAYPKQLADDLALRLTAFRACSGATTTDVDNGMNGEASQSSVLSSNTDLVTITIGGNDIGFSDFAAECVAGTCDAYSSQYQQAMDAIDNTLQGNLELLFSHIHTDAPNAVILVAGYPEVVAPGGNCPVYLSGEEQIAVESVVTDLNNKIRAAVWDSGASFQFIDPTATGSPFIGHDLCSGSSYFFGLNIAEHRFSFHPNADGVSAYEELISNNS